MICGRSRSLLAIALLTTLHLTRGIASAQHPIDRGPWQQRDIGDVGLAGSATEGPDGDLFINGAGSDIWDTADSFFFLYQPIEDGMIRSNSPSEDATNPHAKIGLMIRATLDPDSPHVILDRQPDGSIEFMTRQVKGGSTTFVAGTGPAPHAWGYLTRSSGTVTATLCAFNTTPSCQTLGSVPFPSGFAYAGAVVTSHDPTVLNHGLFPASPPAVITVPNPWVTGDVGAVGVTGSALFQDGTFTVSGAGADIWGTSDAYRVVWTTLSADGSVVARVVSETGANTFAKAGVVANSNGPSGATVILDVRPNGMTEFMTRNAQGGSMSFIAGSAVSFPVWLKVQRTANTFTAFTSTDGSAWQFLASTDVSMPTHIIAGLAVTSHDTSALNTATFDHVAVSSALPIDSDIGDVGATGGVGFSDVNIRVAGAGADIWGTQDAFNYYYSSQINDGSMYARVTFLDNTDPYAKAGIMIRASTDPSAAHVILDVKPDGGIEFMARSAAGSTTTFIAGATRSFPVLFYLVRTGGTVNGYVIDGSQDTLIGSVSIDLPSDALIGLAVTSHVRGTLATATFDQVSR